MNEGSGVEFYRKGNSVKGLGPISKDSERKRHINFFHINFLCRPSSPGLSQGQTGFVPGTNPVKSGFHCVK